MYLYFVYYKKGGWYVRYIKACYIKDGVSSSISLKIRKPFCISALQIEENISLSPWLSARPLIRPPARPSVLMLKAEGNGWEEGVGTGVSRTTWLLSELQTRNPPREP